jgi:hypothetical protein
LQGLASGNHQRAHVPLHRLCSTASAGRTQFLQDLCFSQLGGATGWSRCRWLAGVFSVRRVHFCGPVQRAGYGSVCRTTVGRECHDLDDRVIVNNLHRMTSCVVVCLLVLLFTGVAENPFVSGGPTSSIICAGRSDMTLFRTSWCRCQLCGWESGGDVYMTRLPS